MKNILLALVLGFFSWILFYNELPGLNVLIAQILLSAMIIPFQYSRLSKAGLYLWGFTWLAAATVLLWGSLPAAVLCFGIWTLLLIQLYYPEASLLFSFFHGLCSLLSFPLLIMESRQHSNARIPWRTVLSVGISLLILIVFLIYYRSTNELFDRMVANIPLPDISIPAVRFWLLSSLIIAGMSSPRLIQLFQQAEDYWRLIKTERSPAPYILTAAWVLFSGLNLMIAGMNITDLYYLFVAGIPKDITYSGFLHQSVNASIVSILMAIALIVWMHRQGQAAGASFLGLRILLYVWIFQNILLALISGEKNLLYVLEYGLTHKRLGVFIYLLLCAGGLALTFLMCVRKLNFWFLLRANTWLVVIVLVVSQSVSWDYYIARFNLEQAKTKDREYLVSLPSSGLSVVLKDALEHPDEYNTPQKFRLLERSQNILRYKSSLLEWNLTSDELLTQCQRYSDLNSAELSLKR